MSAVADGVAVVSFTVGISPASIEPRNTARTSPLTARNAAFGVSASRRAASSAGAAPVRRASKRAATEVSHGPATTSPISVSSSPGYTPKPRSCWFV